MLDEIEQRVVLHKEYVPVSRNFGRPTVFNQTTVHKLEQAFMIGSTVEEACILSGVSRSAYYKQLNKDPDFMDRMAYFQAIPVLVARYTVFTAIRNGDAKVAMWYLERKRREEFANTNYSDDFLKSL
jgi:hypothetical protein